ncbi:hypothetical protein PFISCL1PPCAC_5612 [Pristionchus fissidentatus]|uniref:BTB domain-containing protein n=1 Tax=Pristionchus fissidentatus TaxID=1538716 RepID=A0AAV5V3Z8_9BILA|nr:hypothetical protein PFISCL1PPCAC_5612 [Pristionchus fissidentatus]
MLATSVGLVSDDEMCVLVDLSMDRSTSSSTASTKTVNDGRVRLNIGGQVFETTKFTLKRIPETVLSTVVESRWSADGSTEIFIDRDPTHFTRILNFLRDGDSFILPKDEDLVEEIRKEAQFYQIQDLLNICLSALAPLAVGDTVTWRPEAIQLYWRSFVRYSVDDSLSLPFIYERNNHTFARCIGCEEIQDPKGTYIFEINYQDWEPMRHHMLSMQGEVTQLMGDNCCVIVWDNAQTIHLPNSAIRKVFPMVADY